MATSTIDGSSASARESLRSLLSSSDAMSGAAAPLRLRKSTGPQEAAAPAAGVIFENSLSPKVAVWAALAAAEGGAGGELIDEDALIAGEDLSAPKSSDAQGAAGCAPARKACANCSCGCVSGASCILASSRLTRSHNPARPTYSRKEQEEAVASGSALPASAPTSGCGNCGKGDAFRCASCPFLGKPAFKTDAGGAVLLDAGSDF